MRHSGSHPDERARSGDKVFLALAEPDFALEHEQPLLLAAVDMQRWPESLVERALDQAERAVGVRGARLDPHQAALPPELVSGDLGL
jgi:hypothetical protein